MTAELVTLVCVHCDEFPCRCRRPVTVDCACGLTLTASDDLEHKRQAVVFHNQNPIHVAWRWYQGQAR